jgi:hypothetical protein
MCACVRWGRNVNDVTFDWETGCIEMTLSELQVSLNFEQIIGYDALQRVSVLRVGPECLGHSSQRNKVEAPGIRASMR